MRNWEQLLIREGFADGLLEACDTYSRVLVCDADLAASTLTRRVAERFPDRFIDFGIAEQGMLATAAGLALTGWRPFVTSYAMFVAGRAWEIARQQLSYGECGVVVVGAHCGVTVGKDGPTHQCCEDLALMRILPNMTVVVPADYYQMRKVVMDAAGRSIPYYFRMGREAFPVVTSPDDEWQLGRADVLEEGEDLSLVACGQMVSVALDAADTLRERGIRARVVNMHTIKPLDVETLEICAQTGPILTVEEHMAAGGLGSVVAEWNVGRRQPVPMSIIGVEDRYMESGSPTEMLEKAGLTPERVSEQAELLLRG